MKISMPQSLAGRIMGLVFFVSVIPLAIYVMIAVPMTSETIVHTVASSLERQCVLVARDIDRFLAQRVASIRLLSQADTLESNDIKAIHQYLVETSEADPAILNLYFVELDGSPITSSLPHAATTTDELEHTMRASSDLITACVTARQGDVFVSEAMQLPAGPGLLLATPVTDNANEVVIKILISEIPTSHIQEIVSQFDDCVMGNKFVYLVDNGGHVITTKNTAISPLGRFPDLDVHPELGIRFSEPGQVGNLFYRDAEGDEVVAGYADMAEFGVNRALDWSIIAIAPVDTILAPARKMRNHLLVIGLVITLAALVLGYSLSTMVAAPMRVIKQAAEQMQQEKYDTQLPTSRISEIAAISQAFNAMTLTIADRKRQLMESEERFRLITEAAFDAVVILEDGLIVDVNPAFERMFGFKLSELGGRSLEAIVTPESAKKAVNCVNSDNEGLYELVGVCKDGSHINVEVVSRNATFQGRPSRVTAMRDITERKRAEAALRTSEGRLKLFIDHTPAALAMFDRQMCYLAVSRRWIEDYKIAEQEFIGRSHYDIFPEIPESWKAVHRRGLQGEIVRADEDRFERQDGKVQWLRWEVRPWQSGDGNIGGIVIFTEEITAVKQADMAFREIQARQQLLIRAANIGLWDWDLLANQIYFSPEWKSQLGYSDDELPNRYEEWESRLHPDDREVSLKAISDYRARRRENYNSEFRLRHRDGSWRWIMARADMEYDVEGRPTRMMGCHIDITERKQAEKKLIESEWRYRTLFENMNAGFVLFEVVQDDEGTPIDLVIIAANERFEIAIGLKQEEFTGKRLTSILPGIENDTADWIGTYGKVALTGESMQMEQSSELLGYYYSITVYRAAPKQCAVTFTDITGRKLAEEELRRNERMVSCSHDMMALLNRDYVYLAVNDAYLSAFGKTRNDLVGHTVSEVFGQEFFESVIRPHAQSCLDGGKTRYTAWFEFPIPGRRYMDVGYSPYRDADRSVAGFVVCARDITERQKAKDELQQVMDGLEERIRERTRELEEARNKAESADRLKSAFLATMSHELRTPLNSIIGFTGIILQQLAGPINQEQQKQLTMVRDSGQDLLRLINDILDLSKIEAGHLEIHRESFDLMTSLDKCASTFFPTASAKGLQLNIMNVPQAITINGDRRRFEQILLNLLGNAVKFTDKGVVDVKAELIDFPSHHLRKTVTAVQVTVTDTGIGIDPDNLVHLFKPFLQIDNRHARKYEGTGLGLAISAKLAELMDGKIDVVSTVGKGSSFSLTLPLGV